MDVLASLLWWTSTKQRVKAIGLTDTVPEDIREGLNIAIEAIKAYSRRQSTNSFTALILYRTQYGYHDIELLDKAVLLEYCIRMDKNFTRSAHEFLSNGSPAVGEKLNFFLGQSNKDASLMKQFVCLGL